MGEKGSDAQRHRPNLGGKEGVKFKTRKTRANFCFRGTRKLSRDLLKRMPSLLPLQREQTIHALTSMLSLPCFPFHALTFMLSLPCFHFHAFIFMLSLSCFHFHAFTFMLSLSCFHFHAFTFMLSLPCIQFRSRRNAWRMGEGQRTKGEGP